MFLRLHKWLFILLAAMMLTACSSIPIFSLYKVYKFDPFDIDSEQFRIIVRAHEAISIRKGSVIMRISYKAKDDSLTIDDTYLVEIERNGSLPLDVLDDREPREALTLLKLSDADAQQLTETLRLVRPYIENEAPAEYSFRIDVTDICSNEPLRPDNTRLNVYLQSDVKRGFFLLLKNLDISKEFDTTFDDFPVCAGE